MYTRAAASDYDDWATVYGNRGWSSADLLPLLRKVCDGHGLTRNPKKTIQSESVNESHSSAKHTKSKQEKKRTAIQGHLRSHTEGSTRRLVKSSLMLVPSTTKAVGTLTMSTDYTRSTNMGSVVHLTFVAHAHRPVMHNLEVAEVCHSSQSYHFHHLGKPQVDRYQDRNPVGHRPPLHLQSGAPKRPHLERILR